MSSQRTRSMEVCLARPLRYASAVSVAASITPVDGVSVITTSCGTAGGWKRVCGHLDRLLSAASKDATRKQWLVAGARCTINGGDCSGVRSTTLRSTASVTVARYPAIAGAAIQCSPDDSAVRITADGGMPPTERRPSVTPRRDVPGRSPRPISPRRSGWSSLTLTGIDARIAERRPSGSHRITSSLYRGADGIPPATWSLLADLVTTARIGAHRRSGSPRAAADLPTRSVCSSTSAPRPGRFPSFSGRGASKVAA